jgi:GNAT superfamily N-acetyltransferase
MIDIRLMTDEDIPAGLHLGEQAGWNQTAVDWQRMLHLEPEGCFVAVRDRAVIGTTTTTVFGRVAWLAMVLVDESLRGCGIGTALVRRALAYLEKRSVVTIRLDATPLGLPLYQRLGFVAQFEVARFAGAPGDAPAITGVEPAQGEHLDILTALDASATGTDRRRLLHRWFTEEPEKLRCAWRDGRLTGYLWYRSGARAEQLGPCIATPESGPVLLADAWHRHRGLRVFVDIPVLNESATRWAQAQGMTVQRHLTRMCRGVPVCERLDWLWASSGPEKG